ncbi:MAG: DMT family transporter [Desulfovibrio sp.]|nr:DMT family transporter [Desulfovibrio sp.]
MQGFLPHAALITAMIFWGSTFVALRVALTALSPEQTMAGRMLVACLAFLPLWPRIVRALAANGHWLGLFLLGLCEPCLYFLCETHALQLTTASQAGMITALLPLLVALTAFVFLHERITKRMCLGFVLAVSGVAWLTLGAESGEKAVNPLLGNILECLAMCCAAAYTVLTRHLSRVYDAMSITAVQSVVGMMFFCLLVAVVPQEADRLGLGRAFPSWLPWACVVYLGGIVTFAGYGLYNFGVKRLSAGQAAAYVNLIPVFALLCGVLLLDESLLPGQYGGCALILTGVLLSQGHMSTKTR